MNSVSYNKIKLKDKIIDYAFIMFWERGYDGISLNEILKQSGVSKGASYHHFASKEELALAVLKLRVALWVDTYWVNPLKSHREPIKAITRALKAMSYSRELLKGSPLNIFGCPIQLLPEKLQIELRSLYQNLEHSLEFKLKSGLRKGLLSSETSANNLAKTIIFTVEGALSVTKNTGDTNYFKTAIDILMQNLQGMVANYKG